MPKLRFAGPLSMRARSFATINRIALSTYARHSVGRKIAPDWDANFEVGIRFWRHQFTVAMNGPDIARGRLIFDSLVTETDDRYDVEVTYSDAPAGTWYTPAKKQTSAVVLYFHGGGYTFRSGISRRFAAMLAHRTGASLFAPDYRLTPEHPHPAQAEDALAAWHFMRANLPARRIVVCGDSAGGHMALMLLQTLKSAGLPQPALCVGLSPWTDIGKQGESLFENDKYDLVQGWMALRFAKWLDPLGRFGRDALSPMNFDYSGLAPIYIQGGGREILRDMITTFCQSQKRKGAQISHEIFADMPHNFQAYDTLKASSNTALEKLALTICAHVDHKRQSRQSDQMEYTL